MKIAIIEPLGIPLEKIEEASKIIKQKGHEILYYETRTEDTSELIERGKDADVIIIANLPFSKEVIEKCEKLKLLSVAFTGVDHVDIAYCKQRGITVCNAAGYSTNAVAELTFGLIISVLRNIPACDNVTRIEGTKAGLVGCELYGKTFGIVGTGAIGTRVAMIAKAFGCHVLAYSRTKKSILTEAGVTYVNLEELLKQSDIVSLHIPFNDTTKKLIGKEEIALMKKSAILINTARGGVIDTQALAEALNTEKIAGAGIDVFETEPPIAKNHSLITAKHTVLTPHVAFASEEALYKRAVIVFDNIIQWEIGTPKNIIV